MVVVESVVEVPVEYAMPIPATLAIARVATAIPRINDTPFLRVRTGFASMENLVW